MRAGIYCRVSTDEQAERQTIEGQLDACREYCQAKGYEIVAEFRDDGISGATPFDERPEGKRLLEVAGDGLFSKVVVYCVDRLGRDVVEGSLARKELERRGAPLEFVIQSFDGTPEGQLAFNIFLSFAEYERGVIRRRTMAGRARRVKGGKYQASHAPFGYIYSQEAGQLELHPDNADIVRQMFHWAREGLGLKAIATRLEQMGIEPPSPEHPRRKSNWGWHFTTVYKMLTSPRYMGRNTYAGEPMTCPAIVDEATFKAVQEGLRRRKADSSRNTKQFYMLQHLLYCRACGSRYMVKAGPHRVYQCYRRAVYGPKAGHKDVEWRRRAEELEERVKALVRELYDNPGRFLKRVDLTVERVREEYSDGEQAQRVAPLEHRLEELANEEMRIITMARKGHIDETQMLQQLDQVRAERQDVDHELKLARKVAEDADLIVEAAEWFRQLAKQAPMARGFYDEVTGERVEPIPEEWRALIRNVVDKIWVEDDGTLSLEGPIAVPMPSDLKSFR
jgi:site-specific DNA recombinase